MSKLKRGFTLIELIVVIAIISIISLIAISNFTSSIRNSKLAADLENLAILNNSTKIYAATKKISKSDIFLGYSTDTARMNVLVQNEYIDSPVKTNVEDTEFFWHIETQKWLYSLYELSGPGESYDFIDMDLSSFLKTGSWSMDEEGFESSYGLLFIENNNDEYIISTIAELEEGTNGGYGILFETSITDPEHDTGYVMQFDRGYEAVIVRPRTAGSESGPALVISNRENLLIPEDDTDPWWSSEHEITIQVSQSNTSGIKILSAWIDDEPIIEDWEFESNTQSENNYTGFRSWHVDTIYKEIVIEN